MGDKMFDLKDKVVLITGATGGIGGAIARKMKESGATVIVSGRNTQKMDAEFDDSYVKIPCDLASEDGATKLVASAIEKCGRLDVLVNNAGITADTLLMRMTDEQFDNVLNTLTYIIDNVNDNDDSFYDKFEPENNAEIYKNSKKKDFGYLRRLRSNVHIIIINLFELKGDNLTELRQKRLLTSGGENDYDILKSINKKGKKMKKGDENLIHQINDAKLQVENLDKKAQMEEQLLKYNGGIGNNPEYNR